MFRYYATIVLTILVAINLLVIVFCKYFFRTRKGETKFDVEARVLRLKKICYIIFAGLALLLILINLIFK